MAIIAQLVRALDCGSKCRGFESRWSPIFSIPIFNISDFFYFIHLFTMFKPLINIGKNIKINPTQGNIDSTAIMGIQ